MTDPLGRPALAPQPWVLGVGAHPGLSFRDGRLALTHHPAVELDLERMPWGGEPPAIDHPSWAMWFHSLKWLDPLVAAHRDDPPAASSDLDAAAAVARSWTRWSEGIDAAAHPAWNAHPTALRALVLVGLAEFVDEAWLPAALTAHAERLADPERFMGAWNQGTLQSLALLSAGLLSRRDDWIGTAVERLDEAFATTIDDEGATNEQAPGYGAVVLDLLRTTAEVFAANGIEARTDLRAAAERLDRFLAHAVDPSGRLVPLGDTEREAPAAPPGGALEFAVTRGRAGARPAETVAVHGAGYAFVRSGWGEERPFEQESHVSLRFGPGRRIHGHNDHGGLTWFDRGRELVVDGGHGGYVPGPYRDHLRTPAAHSVAVVPGRRFDHASGTELLASSSAPHGAFLSVSDRAFAGATRTRSLLALHRGPLAVVDRVEGDDGAPVAIEQLWHLAPEFELVSGAPGAVELRSRVDGLRLVAASRVLEPEGGDIGELPGFACWRGAEAPVQGWRSTADGHREPAPTAAFSARAARAERAETSGRATIATVLFTAPAEAAAGWSFVREHEGLWRFRLAVDGAARTIRVNADGRISSR